jgi:hypothetical protein
VIDVRIVAAGSLQRPASLSGERVEPRQGLRLYLFKGSEQSFAALVLADRSRDLKRFEALAERVLRTIRA